MQWDEETQATLNGWFSAPQNVWKNWWDVVAGSTQNGHATPATPPVFDIWTGLVEQWRASVQQSMEAFSPALPDGARTAMQQFLMSHGHAQQLMKLATDAWQAIMSNGGSPDEWQQALNRFLEQQRRQMSSAADATKFLQNNAELWQLYNTELQKFTQPWLAMWMQLPQQVGMMGRPGTTGADASTNPLMAMANLYWDTYNQTLGQTVTMPSLGLMREFNEKVNRGFALWQENQQVSQEYQLLLGDALFNAFEAFMQKLLVMAQAGKTVESQTKLLELWVEVADEQFLELFHSERYATTQSHYVNSSMALRSQQRELVEIMLRLNDLPTRSDLDEAHHNIFLLRKEVKALKKTVHELVAQSTATQVVTTTAKSKRTTKTAAVTAEQPTKSSTAKQPVKRGRSKAAQASEGA